MTVTDADLENYYGMMGDEALLNQHTYNPHPDHRRQILAEIADRAARPEQGFYAGEYTERFRKIAGLPPLHAYTGEHTPLVGMLGTRGGRRTTCQLCGQAWPCPGSEEQ